MNRLYEKNKVLFAVAWIFVYCAAQSFVSLIWKIVGNKNLTAACVNILMALLLWMFINQKKLLFCYGIVRPTLSARKLLWYIPLILISSANLLGGVSGSLSWNTVWAGLNMMAVGFCEELLFRGFLFRAFCQQGMKHGAVLSSAIFGLGHLMNVNDFNAAGLFPVLRLAISAAVIGYLFVTLFEKTGSLIPCILAHGAINITGSLAKEAADQGILLRILPIALAASYLWYLRKRLPQEHLNCKQNGDHG